MIGIQRGNDPEAVEQKRRMQQLVEFVPSSVGSSPVGDSKFERAVKLWRVLGETKLGTEGTLREGLYLGRHISLWDVVTTAMVLYRFPLPFVAEEDRTTLLRRLGYRLRPYQGLAARLRDLVLSDCCRTEAGCAEWSVSSRTVLITCFTKSFYHQLLQPVADFIASRHFARVVVVHGGDLAKTRDHDGSITFHSLWDHYDAEVHQVQRGMKRTLRRFQRELFGRAQFKMLMDDMQSHVGDIGVKGELQWLFWREFVRLVPQVAVAEHIVFRHRPALIISADDADQRCRVHSLMAQAAGIPTLLVQQGLSFQDYPEWRFLSHNKVAAMGNSSRLNMIAQGVDPDRIVVTGHPGFDNLASTDPEVQIRVRKEVGVPINHRLVLFASQPSYIGAFGQPKRRIEMIKAIIGVVESIKDLTLLIKPHPGEKRKDLASLIRKKQNVVLVDGSVSIVPLIKSCDVFVTFFSTAALQALYAGKPVITIDVPGSGGGRIYTDSQATWVARTPEELIRYISNLLSPQRGELVKTKEEFRNRLLNQMMHQTDGGATERVGQVVADLLTPERAGP